MCLGNRTPLCAICLTSPLAECCVSTAAALQVRVPTSSPILELPASFLTSPALLCSTDAWRNLVRQFPLFKDSNV